MPLATRKCPAQHLDCMFSVVKFWSGPHSANPKPAAIRRFQSLVSANQLETRNCPADSNYWQSAQHIVRAWTTSHPTHHRPNEAPQTPCALPWCALENEGCFTFIILTSTSSRHAHPVDAWHLRLQIRQVQIQLAAAVWGIWNAKAIV